jgi:Holliday junction DNA helicase RuvB
VPVRFIDIIGNNNLKIQLAIASRAARIYNTSVPHTLFTGAAGCGKTSMAKALALDLNSTMIKAPPESIKSSQDVLDLADKLCVEGYTKDGRIVGTLKPTIVFFDEIHKMPVSGQEALGITMEEWYISIKNKYTKEINEYWIPKFTMVGATTEAGILTKPFRDRFKLIFQFNTYSLEESIQIIIKHAELKKIQITIEGATDIAKRARGVPRLMVGYLERVRDAVVVVGKNNITASDTEAIFSLMGVDSTGLLPNDIKIMKCLYDTGVPVGLETMAVITNESESTVQRRIEPYLIQRGLIVRTGRGRLLTQKGIEYMKENGHVESKRRFVSG